MVCDMGGGTVVGQRFALKLPIIIRLTNLGHNDIRGAEEVAIFEAEGNQHWSR